MGIYNLFLILQNNIVIIGAADKSDDKMIIYHSLSKLQSKFVKRYNNHSELMNWDGKLMKFREFKNVIRENLIDGRIGEVKNKIPLFKIYKKSFLKLFGLKHLKKIQLKEDIYKKVHENEGKKNWNEGIRLPEQSIAQGILSPLQYKVAHFFNGFHTAEEVAKKNNLTNEVVYKILKMMDDLGLTTYIDLI